MSNYQDTLTVALAEWRGTVPQQLAATASTMANLFDVKADIAILHICFEAASNKEEFVALVNETRAAYLAMTAEEATS